MIIVIIRGKWLNVACGVGTIISSFFGAGPIMISPESTPGIKSGAKTGLSIIVCGLLFLVSTVFCPLFASVPNSGTSPVLLMIGMMLFENAGTASYLMFYYFILYHLFNSLYIYVFIYVLYLLIIHGKEK